MPLQSKYKQAFGSAAPEMELDTAHPLAPPPKPGKHTHDDEFQSWWVGWMVVVVGEGNCEEGGVNCKEGEGMSW